MRLAAVAGFRVVLRVGLPVDERVGFLAFAAVVFDLDGAALERAADGAVVLRVEAVFPFLAFAERPDFADVAALLRVVVAFFGDVLRATVFLVVGFFAAGFVAAVVRLVDFAFDGVAFLVDPEILFFACAEGFFAEVLFFPDDLFVDEAALFFAPLPFLTEERELVDFFAVGIAICPSKITDTVLFFRATTSKTRAGFLYQVHAPITESTISKEFLITFTKSKFIPLKVS